MAEPTAITADPISSDGSEESWILLDEMDEAMNEEFNSSETANDDHTDSVDQTTSTETVIASKDTAAIQPIIPKVEIEEAVEETIGYIETISTEAETNSVSLSNDEDDDETNENANLSRLDLKFIHYRIHTFYSPLCLLLI